VSDRIQIEITPDKSRAILTLKPTDDSPFTFEEIIACLAEAGVNTGIMEDRIRETIATKLYHRPLTVANWIAPVRGVDAQIVHLITEDRVLTESSKGRVDYFELQRFKNIAEGSLLIRKIPADEGVPGTTVTGEPVEPYKGTDIDLRDLFAGDGVVIDPNNPNQIIAKRTGIYYREGNRVDVKDELVIDGDIDFNIGNIKAACNLVINGDVKSGFEIISEKNITIMGVVENAYIHAKGDLIVMKGIVKGGAAVVADGKLMANYIVEREEVKAEFMDIKNTIIASNVWARKELKVRKIAGGKTVVGKYMELFDLGNQMGTATRVEVGVDAILMAKSRFITIEIKKLENRHKELKDTLVDVQFALESTSEKLESALFNPHSTASKRMISLLEEKHRNVTKEFENLNREVSEISHQIKNYMTELEKITPDMEVLNPVIIVRGKIFPNVSIKMGMASEVRTVKEHSHIKLSLNEAGKIVSAKV
jgi:uncharacterized protein (DUF342 family)